MDEVNRLQSLLVEEKTKLVIATLNLKNVERLIDKMKQSHSHAKSILEQKIVDLDTKLNSLELAQSASLEQCQLINQSLKAQLDDMSTQSLRDQLDDKKRQVNDQMAIVARAENMYYFNMYIFQQLKQRRAENTELIKRINKLKKKNALTTRSFQLQLETERLKSESKFILLLSEKAKFEKSD